MALVHRSLRRAGFATSSACWEIRDVNSLVGIWFGGLVAVGGTGIGLASHTRPATPPPLVSPATPAPGVTRIDDQGHVYRTLSQAVSPQEYGIVCEYLGPRLTAQRAGRDGVRQSCPATPPAQDLIWPSGGEQPLPLDPADPGIPACRAAGGTPSPPQLGGGGGAGAPVDFCMIAGHLWGPGGPSGAPWGATVVDGEQCRLLGGSYRQTAATGLQPQGYNCLWPEPR
jgi:hypothetical protein